MERARWPYWQSILDRLPRRRRIARKRQPLLRSPVGHLGVNKENNMLKFTLASRHMDEGTRERFFYEWSIIHVSLMLTSPSVMQLFKRYVQHFNIDGVSGDMLVYRFAKEQWESFAEHWVETYQDVIDSVHNPDYIARMQPHKFG